MQTNKPNGTTHKKLFGRSDLYDPVKGSPYMTRWFFGALRVHKMYSGDLQRDCHDHPWWFITFPFTSYVEEVLRFRRGTYYRELNVVKAWRFHFRPARYTHRILGSYDKKTPLTDQFYQNRVSGAFMPAEETKSIWTFVVRGKVKMKWGFWDVEHEARDGEWVPAKTYFDRLGVPYEEGATADLPTNQERTPA